MGANNKDSTVRQGTVNISLREEAMKNVIAAGTAVAAIALASTSAMAWEPSKSTA